MASSSSSSSATTTTTTTVGTANNIISKDDDVAFWLHNKLGSHADLWSSFSISSTLTQEHLQSIKTILKSLDTLVKIKLLLSFAHIPIRNVAEWESHLNEIIEMCHDDDEGDQWVKVISEIMKTFPSKSSFNLDLTNQECEGFMDGIQELRKTVKKNNDTTHLPLESCYLGRSALKILTGDIPNPPKCFSLIRKAKSARVRQDLLDKSAQTSKTRKTSDFPCMANTRRINDEPPTYHSVMSTTPKQSNHGFLKPNTISSSTGIMGTPRLQNRREGHVKLISLEEQQALSDKKRKKPSTEEDESVNGKKTNRNKKTLSTQQSIERSESVADESSSSTTTSTTPNIPMPEFQEASRSDPYGSSISPVTYAPLSHNEMPATPNPVMNNSGNDYFYGLPPSRPCTTQVIKTTPVQEKLPMNQPILTNIKLTDEQNNFARELFATSPCLTRIDKIRILNFIAGVRDNDQSTLTNPVVTIKLSEHNEEGTDPNTGQQQNFSTETFFQMNTSTGEWKRIKKLRPIDSMQ